MSGGADTIRQFLASDLLDEFTVHTAPVLLGAGKRLFDGLGARAFAAEPAAVSHSPLAAHATWRVRRDPAPPSPTP